MLEAGNLFCVSRFFLLSIDDSICFPLLNLSRSSVVSWSTSTLGFGLPLFLSLIVSHLARLPRLHSLCTSVTALDQLRFQQFTFCIIIIISTKRFNAEEVRNFLDDDPPTVFVDSSGPHDFTTIVNEVGSIPHTFVANDEEVVLSASSEEKQATPGPEPEDDDIVQSEFETSSMPATVTKRHVVSDNSASASKKSKKDRRKELPTLSRTKNSTQARNHLAQAFQDCASAKAAALVTIEEKKLKFEQMKWETKREEREVRREERELRRREEKEDERVRREEEKAEKCRERKFTLIQTLLADGKSPDEIKEIMSTLL